MPEPAWGVLCKNKKGRSSSLIRNRSSSMSEAPIPGNSPELQPKPAQVGFPKGQLDEAKAAAPTATMAPATDRMAKLAVEEAMAKLRAEQNLVGGIAAGAAAALATAILWAVITAATKYQIGWMAIGVGFAVGMAVKFVGKGVDTSFRISGAALAILGCVLGNVLTISYLAADHFKVSLWEVLGKPSFIVDVMKADFGFMDLIFYGIAAYCGWQYSLRSLSEEDLKKVSGEAPKQP